MNNETQRLKLNWYQKWRERRRQRQKQRQQQNQVEKKSVSEEAAIKALGIDLKPIHACVALFLPAANPVATDYIWDESDLETAIQTCCQSMVSMSNCRCMVELDDDAIRDKACKIAMKSVGQDWTDFDAPATDVPQNWWRLRLSNGSSVIICAIGVIQALVDLEAGQQQQQQQHNELVKGLLEPTEVC